MKPLPGQTIPASAFMIFQAMFAAITPGKFLIRQKKKFLSHIFIDLALAFGSAAERMSVCSTPFFLITPNHKANLRYFSLVRRSFLSLYGQPWSMVNLILLYINFFTHLFNRCNYQLALEL